MVDLTPYRTSTVLALCQSMRESQDFSACPILADALQDADFGLEHMLKELRESEDLVIRQKLVAIIFSEDSRNAVNWIEGHTVEMGFGRGEEGHSVPMTYAKLMKDAAHYVWTGETINQDDDDRWETAIDSEEFWKNYEKVIGLKPQSRWLVGSPYESSSWECSDC